MTSVGKGRRGLAVLAPILFAFLVFAAQAAAALDPQTFVSGLGDDVNPCTRAAPCKTFAGAISKTAAGGEIDALDPGGYGGMNITKSITIDGSRTIAGVLNAGSTGININAGAGDDVVIRGVSIGAVRSSAPPDCPFPSVQNAIVVTRARSVSIEDTRIANQATGIKIVPDTQAVPVTLANVAIRNTCVAGVDVAPTGGGSSDVILQDARIQGSKASNVVTDVGAGLRVGAHGHAFVIRSTIFDNSLGIQPLGGGLIDFYTDSQLIANGIDGTPTASPGPSVTGPTGPVGGNGPAGNPGNNGQAGAQGPAGAAVFKLVLALLDSSLTGTSGRKVTLEYISTVNGDGKLEVRKGSKTVATTEDGTKAGRNSVAWNGKIKGKAAAAGDYKLKLTVQTSDGQKTSQTAKLTLKKAR
jgi:hypothetical protein